MIICIYSNNIYIYYIHQLRFNTDINHSIAFSTSDHTLLGDGNSTYSTYCAVWPLQVYESYRVAIKGDTPKWMVYNGKSHYPKMDGL
jgi:hypothetical protein